MKQQIQALQAEWIKTKSAKILWATFLAFAIVPVLGGICILVVQDKEVMAKTSDFALRIKAMNFEATWESYFGLLNEAVGVGGVILFGFVASWIFGREYSDGTIKDLLSLPTPRVKILNAKFILYAFWCLALAFSNLIIAFILGKTLQLPNIDNGLSAQLMTNYLITTILTITIVIPTGFFAIYGKGFLVPLGFVTLTIIFSHIIAGIGYGTYFPWSVPGLYSGASGEFKMSLNNYSYGSLILTSIAGYIAAVRYWNKADHTK